MTNEDAIRILSNMIHDNKAVYGDKPKPSIEALKLAIQALETGEIYITGEDYNLYMEGYKAGKKDFEPKQGEWIPVSERLPEALQSVLVTSTSGRVYTSYIAHGDWEYGGDVIAWQPLPEPYEKGSAE